jgi:hypothetical protein
MPQGCRAGLFNFLAVIFLGLSIVTLGWVVEIALNPYGRLNPFPPSTPVAAVALPGETPTPDLGTHTPSPTWTATPADTETPTPLPTVTPAASPTPWPPTVTPWPSPTRSALTYTAAITYQVHPVQLCDWMGVAGTVTDLQGRHALGAFVHIWGLGGVDEVAAIGTNPSYGASGWELRLGRAQIVGNWNVQLVASPDAKVPLSDAYTISMPGDCNRNLALVRFRQNH